MHAKGHDLVFTCRDRQHIIALLEHEGFEYECFGKNYITRTGKIRGLFTFTSKLIALSRKKKPDVFLSHSSMYAAFAAFFTGKAHISFEDTFNFEQIRLYKPFTKAILTGDYPHPLQSRKVIRYSGYHELAYLHPNRFTPDDSVLQDLEVKPAEKYVVMRFVSWNASHDVGHHGINLENKIKAVQEFAKYARVFITSESGLPEELQPYKINIPPHKMHDVLAFADLVWGESSTMSEEAAMLGVPSVYLFNNSTYYTTHLEQDYRLLYNYSESGEDQEKAIEKGVELLRTEGIKEQWQKKRNIMLKDKIDVTAFLVWFIENYPESFKVIKEYPDYHYSFK